MYDSKLAEAGSQNDTTDRTLEFLYVVYYTYDVEWIIKNLKNKTGKL